MAYVALAMNNPSIALHESKQLLAMPHCSKENKYRYPYPIQEGDPAGLC